MTDIGEYRLLGKLGEGTFSEVLRVRNKKNGKTYAMKRFRKHFNNIEDIENLREIQALRRLNHHPNIIQLEEVIFDAKYGILSLAFEIMDSNLYEALCRKGQPPIHELRVKWAMWQITKALDFVHSKGIFHRDIKPENILVRGDINAVPIPFPNANPASPFHHISSFPIVKLADFGSCRGIHSKMPYTEYIATRWYRSPECLLFDGVYTYKMDVWGIGCVLFELLTKVPLFPGDNELDQLHKIHHVMGSPSEKLLKSMVTAGQNAILNGVAGHSSSTSGKDGNATQQGAAAKQSNSKDKAPKNIFKRQFSFPPAKGTGLKSAIPPHVLHGAAKVNPKANQPGGGYSPVDYPGLSEECIHLLELLLQYDPDARPTARHALKHPWLKECRDAEATEKAKQQASTTQQPVPGAQTLSEKTANLSVMGQSNVGNALPAVIGKAGASKPMDNSSSVVVDPSKILFQKRPKATDHAPVIDPFSGQLKPKQQQQPSTMSGSKTETSPVLPRGASELSQQQAPGAAAVKATQMSMAKMSLHDSSQSQSKPIPIQRKDEPSKDYPLVDALLSPTALAKRKQNGPAQSVAPPTSLSIGKSQASQSTSTTTSVPVMSNMNSLTHASSKQKLHVSLPKRPAMPTHGQPLQPLQPLTGVSMGHNSPGAVATSLPTTKPTLPSIPGHTAVPPIVSKSPVLERTPVQQASPPKAAVAPPTHSNDVLPPKAAADTEPPKARPVTAKQAQRQENQQPTAAVTAESTTSPAYVVANSSHADTARDTTKEPTADTRPRASAEHLVQNAPVGTDKPSEAEVAPKAESAQPAIPNPPAPSHSEPTPAPDTMGTTTTTTS